MRPAEELYLLALLREQYPGREWRVTSDGERPPRRMTATDGTVEIGLTLHRWYGTTSGPWQIRKYLSEHKILPCEPWP